MHRDTEKLRRLPKIDRLIDAAVALEPAAPRWALAAAARDLVESIRGAVLRGERGVREEIAAEDVIRRAEVLARPSLRRVINGTGVVLHTNLGRAPLPPQAVRAIDEVSRYSNLELDLDSGDRGSRHDHVAQTLVAVCGVEDAVVVNNNAAAVMLALAGNAAGREVIVSRGELIEIGGSFRIPDVMALSGATLVEVGTTNKTRSLDYAEAVTANTGLLLKVHRANFEIVGFAAEVSSAELAEVGRTSDVPTMMDLGSGALLASDELDRLGLEGEPTIAGTIGAGIDLITFSCDKLLGGPQAGVIAGRRDLVARARKHPLMRAVRPGKMTLAALHATLELYRRGEHGSIPTVAALACDRADLRARAQRIVDLVSPEGQEMLEVVETDSTVGGGAKPTAALPSWAVRISCRDPDVVASGLRNFSVPVVARIHDDAVLIDVRCVVADELEIVAAALSEQGRLRG